MKNLVRMATAVLIFAALPAAAQSWDWSSPASAGIADTTTTTSGLWEIVGPTIKIKSNAITYEEFRYPVTNTVGSSVDISPAWGTLEISYSDNSSTAGSVVAKLIKIEKCSATETELCSVTSSDGDGSTTCSTCTFSGGVDFANNAYYVYVVITKSDLPADPKLHEVAVY